MKILKQQQVNDVQKLLELEKFKLSKTQIEAVIDAYWDMVMIHQKAGDAINTPIGIFESYVKAPTTYTNPQHPEGERIQAPARVVPKLNFARAYVASYKHIPVNQTTLERE